MFVRNPLEEYGNGQESVFSQSGKLAILEFKANAVANKILQIMLVRNNVRDFTVGKFTPRLVYNCTVELEPYRTFPEHEEHQWVAEAAFRGVNYALWMGGIPKEDRPDYQAVSKYLPGDPRFLDMTVTLV